MEQNTSNQNLELTVDLPRATTDALGRNPQRDVVTSTREYQREINRRNHALAPSPNYPQFATRIRSGITTTEILPDHETSDGAKIYQAITHVEGGGNYWALVRTREVVNAHPYLGQTLRYKSDWTCPCCHSPLSYMHSVPIPNMEDVRCNGCRYDRPSPDEPHFIHMERSSVEEYYGQRLADMVRQEPMDFRTITTAGDWAEAMRPTTIHVGERGLQGIQGEPGVDDDLEEMRTARVAKLLGIPEDKPKKDNIIKKAIKQKELKQLWE